MKKYAFGFGIFYSISCTVLHFFAEKLKLSGGIFSFIITLLLATAIACIFSAWWYTKEQDCCPNYEEEKLFAWQSVLYVWFVMFLFLILPYNDVAKVSFSKNGYLLFLLSRVVAAAIYASLHYFFIRYIFSWYATIAHGD